MSARMIEYGDADVMVCGGSESSVTPLAVGGFASEAGPDQPVRVLVCTSLHADRAEEGYRKLGLKRELDLRPVLYKDVRSDTP